LSRSLSPVMLMLTILLLPAGCSTPARQQDRSPVREPRILEEDIADRPSSQTQRSQEQNIANPLENPTDYSTNQAPPVLDPGARPPRKFIWRDRQGSGRGWTPSSAAPEEQTR
jgi:hypothetical protein